MKHTPFKLILTLGTAFHIADMLCLDGLLSAAVYNQTGLIGKETIPHIPLAMEKGIFKGSALFMDRRYRHETVGRTMMLKGESDLSIHAFSPNGRAGKYMPVEQRRLKYKANMSAYPGIFCRNVYFYGVGDPEAVVMLMQDNIIGIGKRANAGAGQILHIEWEPEEDYSWIAPDGHPARPLPEFLWNELSGKRDCPVIPLTVSLPYWNQEKVPAVFPHKRCVQ